MRTAILSVTERGALLGQKLREFLAGEVVCYEKEGRLSGKEAISFTSMGEVVEEVFFTCDRLLFITATGIAVRMIAPCIQHKSKDPAVLVMDERGQFTISLLSGHLGGANEWAQEIASHIDTIPVITTATDVNGMPAPDVLARKLGLEVEDFSILIKTNAAIVAGVDVQYYVDDNLFLLEEYHKIAEVEGIHLQSLEEALKGGCFSESQVRVVITDNIKSLPGSTLYLRPKTMVIGIGCRRDTPEEMLAHAVISSLEKLGKARKSIFSFASVDVKADEKGLLSLASHWNIPIVFYGQEEMKSLVEELDLEESNFVKNTIGVGNVCETTSLLTAKSRTLLQEKTIYPRTTVAVARVNLSLSELVRAMRRK